jgi:hypothetical protein
MEEHSQQPSSCLSQTSPVHFGKPSHMISFLLSVSFSWQDSEEKKGKNDEYSLLFICKATMKIHSANM